MPTINNATVVTSTGATTSGGGRRNVVRTANGWLIAAVKLSSGGIRFYKSTDEGATWVQMNSTSSNYGSYTIVVSGNFVHFLRHTGNNLELRFSTLDVINDTITLNSNPIDTLSSTIYGEVAMEINAARTEIHIVQTLKHSTYPNSFNIRYMKGTVAADNMVTWGTPVQITTANTTGVDYRNPAISINANGYPVITAEGKPTTTTYGIYRWYFNGSSWSATGTVFDGGTNVQSSPTSSFIPQSINGLASGMMWLAWQGKDSTDSAKFNIRVSSSSNGGITWGTPVKLTTGNLYNQMNPSITADKTNKVLLYWDGEQDSSGSTVSVTKEMIYANSAWGNTNSLVGDNHYGVSTLYDTSFPIVMTRAPLVRYLSSGVRYSGDYSTNLPASISPLSSALGDKTNVNIITYTVTPTNGTTITSIVEKVNGTTVNTYSNPASLSRTFTIPLANWDALKYYNTHTISVTVTDSNGMANTQVYSFNKTLANDASLLEGAKAAKDGKDRISTKRDVLAGQVGLPAGSTFDAISAAIDSRNVVKRQSGTATVSGGSITISTLTFLPKSIMIRASATQIGQYNADMAINESRNGTTITNNAFSNITSSGFTAAISGTSVTWEAWN